MGKGLTATIVFDAMSLNYGEGLGNISELKRLAKGGEYFSYLSRQALRYDVYRMMQENFNTDEGKQGLTEENKVIQFKPDTNIKDYVEADLFGYMKTKKGSGSVTRSAVVRFSPAIALEPFLNDVEFGSNKNFADRVTTKDKTVPPNPFQFEHHHSLYTYTVTIDLDRVGKDEKENIEITEKEKAERVNNVLDVIKVLNREIKARTESLNPLFIIGGVYNIKNPFFMNRIKLSENSKSNNYSIETGILKSTVETSFNNQKIKEETSIGYISGFWKNENEFKEITDNVLTVEAFFEQLKSSVNTYYHQK